MVSGDTSIMVSLINGIMTWSRHNLLRDLHVLDDVIILQSLMKEETNIGEG
jgi:hypothetical protein